MDLVEKNIALTQEHKVLEALMKLRIISIMNISAQSSNLSLLYLNFSTDFYKILEIEKVKNQQKKVKD